MREFINLQEAIEYLNADKVVAIPTETVYGLAARVDSETALEKIFKTKERPFFDPLIVHISDLAMLQKYVLNPDPLLLLLAQEFWPGPLTIVFDKNPNTVSDLITSGQPTVALRCPKHPMALALIKTMGSALAAPSANPFKKTSPTEAAHVRDYFPELPILDGGPCDVGLESTIIRWQKIPIPTLEILRPGHISSIDLKHFFIAKKIECEIIENFNSEGPGSMKEHYQPNSPLYIFKNKPMDLELSTFKNKRIEIINLHPNPLLCARTLYKSLIEGSKVADILVLEWTHDLEDANWSAIYNRLEKAAKEIF